MKYEIPETSGAMGMCEKYVVTLGESPSDEKFNGLKSYLLYWPDCCGMGGTLCEFIENLNALLQHRHLDNLKWSYREFDCLKDCNCKVISVCGMYLISEKVRPKKHTIIVDGESYKVDAEKLMVFLKSLE